MEQNEKKVTLKVSSYQAGKIYQLLMEKCYNFTKAKIPSVAKQYYKLAEYTLKQIDKCE